MTRHRSTSYAHDRADASPRRTPRRRIAAVLVAAVAVLATACTTAGQAGAPSDGTAPQAGAPDPPVAPPVAPSPSMTIPADARAVVTSTGVPVTVVDHQAGHVLVRTPCGNTATLTLGQRIEPVRVVLDPGHGGPVDTGTVGPNGLQEGDLNLRLANAAEAELESRGIPSALTRTADYAVPLPVRAEFASAAGAEVLVSLHHNAPASARSNRPGTEVFVQSTDPRSSRLGGLLYESVVDALGRYDVAWTSRHDAGVLRVTDPDGNDVYGMIRRPTMPAVLLELGYLANPSEAAFFATETYPEVAATAIADAIEAYLESDREGSGFVAEPRVFKPRGSQAAQQCTDPVLE